MSDLVQVTYADGVCEIQLARPEKRNAISLEMYAALTLALRAADADADCRVILLSGAGGSFTAGNDLHDFLSGPESAAAGAAEEFLGTLQGLETVLMAAVHGQAVGIGATLLLHCDLVVAARDCRLSMPFVRLGLVPEAGSSLLLPRLVGRQRAAEMLMLGGPVDAEAALAMGLVNRVVDAELLMTEARVLAAELARQPPRALRATKRLMRPDPASLGAQIRAELDEFRERLASQEFRSAAQAFLTRRRSPEG